MSSIALNHIPKPILIDFISFFVIFCMAPFCPGSALHIHPAPVLVKGQEECICLSNQLADWCLRSAGFIDDVCRGFSLPYSLRPPFLSMYIVLYNAQLSIFAIFAPFFLDCRGE